MNLQLVLYGSLCLATKSHEGKNKNIIALLEKSINFSLIDLIIL